MALKQCERCRARRDVGDEALNGWMSTIGKLVRVEKDGTEYWQYFK
jgi:hypothetical protein